MRLYDYWHSAAAYRVRIALRLKGLTYEQAPVNLRQGAQRTLEYLAHNPQGLVPTLADGEAEVTQSLAIIEWLDELWPEPPLLPRDPLARATVRSLALQVASDIQPLTNLRVMQHLQHRMGIGEHERTGWLRHWIIEGLASLERRLAVVAGTYAYGDTLTLADLCLVPQVYNARRYHCDLAPFPVIRRVDAACLKLAAFAEARPERQPDAS
jgi:maleylpyruvate isomerase